MDRYPAQSVGAAVRGGVHAGAARGTVGVQRIRGHRRPAEQRPRAPGGLLPGI